MGREGEREEFRKRVGRERRERGREGREGDQRTEGGRGEGVRERGRKEEGGRSENSLTTAKQSHLPMLSIGTCCSKQTIGPMLGTLTHTS